MKIGLFGALPSFPATSAASVLLKKNLNSILATACSLIELTGRGYDVRFRVIKNGVETTTTFAANDENAKSNFFLFISDASDVWLVWMKEAERNTST